MQRDKILRNQKKFSFLSFEIHVYRSHLQLYYSLGAGGTKARPDLGKQRSLSGTPSPCHSRSASASSDLANIVRSSSEGNLADPTELAERLKQGM